MSQAPVKKKSVIHDNVWIELSKSNLLKNLATLKSKVSEDCKVMAIIKANAYGHGLIQIAKILENEVTYLAVSSMVEALKIRKHEIKTPIFILGRLFGEELQRAIEEGFTLGVSSIEGATAISDISGTLSKETKIHIKVDTGMGRLGIPFRNAIPLIERMIALPHLVFEGLYTHLPTAEKNDGFAEKQINDFSLLIEALRQKEIVFRYRHATNSAGTLKYQHPALNMMRPGLMLYGVFPHEALKELASLFPVLSLNARISFVKYLKPGESAGYGRDFVARDLSTIGILPLGYSHGYPFRASSKAEVIVHERKYRLAGRISMDFIAVNFNNQVLHPETLVTLIGKTDQHEITIEDLANWAGTIPYEILTHLLPNIPRLIKD